MTTTRIKAEQFPDLVGLETGRPLLVPAERAHEFAETVADLVGVHGLIATREFAHEGIATNVTLCFSPTQALLAAKCGATFISASSAVTVWAIESRACVLNVSTASIDW